ncbi:MAG: amidohydrolase family protein [Pirellulaceae bacterium]|nr:amidohydrolase family protein [Pirellulaceae bacterium]
MIPKLPPHPSRRSFINQCLAGASALPLASALLTKTRATAQDKQQPAVDSPGSIDAHVHVWTPDIKQYPLGPNFKVDDMQPPSFTDAELLGHCNPLGVDRIVLVQMSFYQYDHRYMLQVMRKHPGTFSGVGLIDHRSPQLGERIVELAASGIRGFRIHSMGDADDWVADPGMHRLWRQATEEGLAICPLINPTDIPYVEALCKKFPDTTVVVDHFARIGVSGTIEKDPLDRLCRLARFPNTHVKTSAFYALGKKTAPYDDLIPMMRRVLDSYGPERLMWGSDCPYQVQDGGTYESSLALIRDRIDFLSDSDRQWLLRRTAEKVFFA